MTIGTIVYLINGMHPHGLDNGSVTILEYEDGQFSVEVVGDRSYRELGPGEDGGSHYLILFENLFKPRQRRLAVDMVTDFVSSIQNLKTVF